MSSIRQKIEQIITGTTNEVPFWMDTFLSAVEVGYGAVVKTIGLCHDNGIFRQKQLPCPVISIGNITAGGTGKTPMTIYMAELLTNLGYSVTVLSRGYRGQAEKRGGIVTDGKKILMTSEDAGDEPYMMAVRLKSIPIVIGQDRYESGMRAVKKFNPDVILLDDGFQHRKLFRNLDIVLMDACYPFGNGHMLPRGALREPVSSLKRASVIVLTRFEEKNSSANLRVRQKLTGNIPIFRSFHKPRACFMVKKETSEVISIATASEAEEFRFLKDKRAFVFSGIAKNCDFTDMITDFGCIISGEKSFSDHYQYSDGDLTDISAAAKNSKAEIMITTEKDYARVAGRTNWPLDLFIVGIDIEMKTDTVEFQTFISDKIKAL